MRRTSALIAGILIPFFTSSLAFAADTTVKLEKTHLCCPSCVKDATAAVDTVPGAKADCDLKAKTITITAPDDATAQKAVDALVAAGFFGEATGATVKDDTGVLDGKVKSLKIEGIHDCCGKCVKAIDKTIKSVPGAAGEIEPKSQTVTITGDFNAKDMVKAFNDAGFSVKVAPN